MTKGKRSKLRGIIFTLSRVGRDVYLNGFCASPLVPRPIRGRLLVLGGISIERSAINSRCFFGGTNVSIGAISFVNHEVFFDCADRITIGRNCQIGMRALFITGSHEIGPPDQRAVGSITKPIHIGDGCWIGAYVTVLPGVIIGPGCVIGAGTLVASDCLPNGVYAGIPARRIRDLETSDVDELPQH